jgi:hypothetical protein
MSRDWQHQLHKADGKLRISAVIPTYNEEDVIYWAIQYLVSQDIHVHVLDNESTDMTPQIVGDFPLSQVSLSSFHTGGEFDEKRQGESIQAVFNDLEARSDWLIKSDADEFLEAPFLGMSLRQGIEIADMSGFNCIGARGFAFFPMSDEAPHLPGDDVRTCYDRFKIWDKVNRWTPDIHPECNELWKVNVFKCRAGVFYLDPHRVSPLANMVLFPHLFVLRHYPYRHPERTRRRLLKERKDRMSSWNVENRVSCHYTKYSEEDTFLYDDIEDEMERWSQFRKPRLSDLGTASSCLSGTSRRGETV